MEHLQFGSITIFERGWRCTPSPGWGQGQGEPTGRTWSLPVSVSFTVRAVLLIFTSYSKTRWPALLPCDVLPWQLGGDQGGCHPCSAGGGYKVEPFLSFIGLFLLTRVQERTDCRGPEDPDGKVENVNVCPTLVWNSVNLELLKHLRSTKDSRNTVIVFWCFRWIDCNYWCTEIM